MQAASQIVLGCVILACCIFYLHVRKRSKLRKYAISTTPIQEPMQLPVIASEKVDSVDNLHLEILVDRVRRFERCLWQRYTTGDAELVHLSTYLEQLHRKMDNLEILEGFVANRTSYSIGKQRIVLCMRSKEPETWSQLIDENIVTFALIHELGHISCPCIDHPPEFINLFRNLLYQAIRYGIWKPVDYTQNPVRYCGKTVAAVPLNTAEMHLAASMPLKLEE